MNKQAVTKLNLDFSLFVTRPNSVKAIEGILGKGKSQQFIASICSAVQSTPSLQECTKESIFNAALLGASLNLNPSPQLGQFYIVPYKNNKLNVSEGQFQMGYKGYIQLALRSGQYEDIDVVEIREGEYLGRDSFSGKPKFKFIEDEEQRLEKDIIGYLAYFEMKNEGAKKRIYWSKEKMLLHADKYSSAFSLKGYKARDSKFSKVSYEDYLNGKYPKEDEWKYSSNWYKNFDDMAFKTMIRQLISKWGIMSIETHELQIAIEKDMGVINEDGTVNYVDNQKIVGEAETIVDNSAKEQKTPLNKNNEIKEVDNNFFD